MDYLVAFGIAFGFSFVGMLPPGMLNMTVIGLNMNKGFKIALFFAIGAAFVEFFQSLLVIKFADKVQVYLEGNVYVNWVAVVILLVLGISFLLAKPKKENIKEKEVEGSTGGAMVKGMTLALANVLVYAFWLAQGIYWNQQGVLRDEWSILITFSVGIFLGSVAAYLVYIALGEKILKRFDAFANNLNKVLAGVFFVLAALQLAQTIL